MHAILENISLLTRMLQHPVSEATLATMTPRDQAGNFDYRILREVLLQQGFENHLQKRELKRIPPLALPAVALLRNGHACVLQHIDAEGGVEIQIAGDSDGVRKLSAEEFTQNYLGYVWFIKNKPENETRSELPEYRLSKGWFWRVIWRFRRYYYHIILATVVINVLALVSSLYVMNVYNRVIPNKAFSTLWVLSLGVMLSIGFEFVAKLMRGHLTDIAGKKADLIISSALFRRVMQIKMENKPVSAGSYANNLRDFESVREFMTSASLLALVDMPFFLLFIGVMYIIGGKLALVPMTIIPLVIVVGFLAQIPLARYINESMRESSQRQGLAVEAVDGIETLKVNNAYSWVQKRWDHYIAVAAAASNKTKNLSNVVTYFTVMMQQLNTVFLVVVGTYLVNAPNPYDRITMGALIASVILSGRALAPVGQIAGLAVRYQSAKLALHGVDEICERPIERDPERKYITFDHPQGTIGFSNCSFAYDKSGKIAVNDVNLSIKAGERVAIIGRIGSGKTTLLKLAAALYEQQKGVVTFDGVDLRQIDTYYLRNQIALLGQNPRLFLGTLRQNLDMARADGFYKDDVLLGALASFGVAQIIQQHPQGLDMPIGEHGAGLSGGQQQIVALARLTLRDPRVVLLDEPTSGLDQGTEQQVLHTLAQWIRGRTLLLVTHRPQLLALVERIVVMEQGKIIMDGPRQEILERLAQTPANGKAQGNAS